MGCLISSRALRQSPICRHCRENTSTCLHLSTCSQRTKSTTQTWPRIISDAYICSDNEKYGGFGATTYNLLCHRDLAAPARTVAAESAAPARAFAAVGAPGKEKSPPVTVANKAVTSSGKHVTNYITLAAAHAPVKKVIPAVPTLDVAPAPFFLTILRHGPQLMW